jgi:hypothetical protein
MHWQPAERRNEANCRRRMRPALGRCVRRCGDGGYDDLARHRPRAGFGYCLAPGPALQWRMPELTRRMEKLCSARFAFSRSGDPRLFDRLDRGGYRIHVRGSCGFA